MTDDQTPRRGGFVDWLNGKDFVTPYNAMMGSRENELVRDKLKKAALVSCDEYLKEFAACAKGRTVSVIYACRTENRAMNDCLGRFTTPEEYARLQREYLVEKGRLPAA